MRFSSLPQHHGPATGKTLVRPAFLLPPPAPAPDVAVPTPLSKKKASKHIKV